jgi:hypothetical protein
VEPAAPLSGLTARRAKGERMGFAMRPQNLNTGELRVLLREALVTLAVNVLSGVVVLALRLLGGMFSGDLGSGDEKVRFLKWSGLGLATGIFYVGLTLAIFFAVKVVKRRKQL